jgi:hypothetical protein
MRINDIINEEQISEIPVGIGARLATAAKAINPFSTSGRNIAQGSQVSNKKANELYAAYYKWVGQRNMPTDAKSVTNFLTSIGAPPAAIQAAKLKLVAPAPVPTPEGKIRTLEAAPGVALDKNVIGAAFLAAAQAGAQLAPGGATNTSPVPPASVPPAPVPPASVPPAPVPPASVLGVKQINAAIPKLRSRDLQSVKRTVDAAITSKTTVPESVIFHSKFLDQEI